MFNDEYTAQCDAVLDVLAAAGVRLVAPNPEQAPPPEVWVPLRPAMHVLRVPDADQRRFEQRLTRPHTDPDHLRGHFLVLADGHTVLFLELHHMQDLLHRGRHRVCIKFTTWYCRVVAALMRHGTYDPEHNHEPHPGEEIDAIERREELQSMFALCFPDLSATPQYRIVQDEDGNETVEEINSEEEQDDDD